MRAEDSCVPNLSLAGAPPHDYHPHHGPHLVGPLSLPHRGHLHLHLLLSVLRDDQRVPGVELPEGGARRGVDEGDIQHIVLLVDLNHRGLLRHVRLQSPQLPQDVLLEVGHLLWEEPDGHHDLPGLERPLLLPRDPPPPL